MKLFHLIQKYWAAMGIEPLQPFQKKQTMVMLIRRLLAFIPVIVCALLLSAFLAYEAKTLNEYADSFAFSASMVSLSIIFLIMLWKVDSFFKLIGDFEKLIEKRVENSQSKQTYLKFNENIEKWTGVFYFIGVQVTVPAILMPKFIISFYLYFTTDLGGDAFSLPLLIWSPFNWRTPIGYLIIYTIQSAAIISACHVSTSYIVTFTASCYMIFTFCNGIKYEIHSLEECRKAGQNSVEFIKRVGDIVAFHSEAKQLVFEMDNVFALSIIIYFAWSLLSICSTLLVAQMELEHNFNPLELMSPISTAFWSITRIFLICEFGQMLTNHFDQFTNVIYNCDWTLFPKEIQKILPIIIQNTQREIILETFQNTSCSRESFKKVVNGGFSYFMVFREFR